jgi:phytoene dehydrogenase-like protein
MTTKTYDVIVVGGGLAGLAAGATAAKAGATTVVLEGHGLGGRARCVERDGFVFNMGAHALYMGSVGLPVLRGLGVEPHGPKPPLDRYMALRDGELFKLPIGPASLLTTKLLGARDKAQFSKALLGVARLDPAELAQISTADWIAGLDLRPRAQSALEALVRISTYAGDFDHLSADAAVTQIKAGTDKGVIYLDGGWDQLTHSLAALVEVRSGRVTGIDAAAGRVEVRTDGETLVAKSVVLAAGPPAAARALLPADPGWGDLGQPVTAACLDVAARRVPTPGYVLGIDVPIYGTTQSPPARQSAPAGGAVVSVIRYGARSAELDRPDLEAHLRTTGVAADDVIHDRFLARMVVAGTAPSPANGGLAGRPRVTDTGLGNVYLAGDWVGPDGMLADAALSSGAAAARLAVRSADGAATMVA